MPESFDVIVVGVGAMGSAACLHLARRGVRVLGLEQFDVPTTRGSSHGHSRMIRMCYYEHADYVPLLRRAYELWRELEQASGRDLLHITGGLYMGPRGCETIAGALKTAQERGLEHELLGHADAARRFPQFALPDDHVALYEPGAGYLVPERVVATQAEQAMRAGAAIRAHEPVMEWRREGDGVRVTTTRGEFTAARIIFTAGAWTSRLLVDSGVKLIVTRQVMAWVWPKKPELFERGRLPVWAIDHSADAAAGLYYGFPMIDEGVGFKLALHKRGDRADPDHLARDARPGDEETVRSVIRSHIPDADGPLLALRVCMYTNSPDSHFIIDRYADDPRVLIAAGFSGHGFKFASVVGEVLADLAIDGAARHPVAFLGLGRFSS